MGIVQELLQRHDSLHRDRSNFESYWSEIAKYVLSRQDEFLGEQANGAKRNNNKFDDTATLALNRGAAAVESILIPRTQKWHSIRPPEEARGDYESELWADNLRDFLFRMRYEPRRNFASQAHEYIIGLLAFGTSVMSIEDDIGKGVMYKSHHLSENCITEDATGIVNANYRKFKLTAAQALEKYGKLAPPKVLQAVEKDPNRKMEFLHVSRADDNGDAPDGMPYVSYHISIEDNSLIKIGGNKRFPYIVSRWEKAPSEVYGRSPAMDVLAEIKTLNKIRKSDLRAKNYAASPAYLAADQRSIRAISIKSDHINYGTLDMNGRELLKPLQTGANIAVLEETIEQSRAVINSAFFLDLFQILVDSPQMTATEVLTKAQEKSSLLSPPAGRQETEFLNLLIEGEISIYEDYGVFEDGNILEMPRKIKELGGAIEIKYTNPLSNMQNSEDALAAEKTIQSLIPAAQIDPSVLSQIDWSGYADIIRKANGAPTRLFKSPEVKEMEDRQRAEQEQMAMIAQLAPTVTGGIKDLAQANALSRKE